MAGYIGTKAVLLSTTAASVTGNADIGGDLTVTGEASLNSLSVDTSTLFVDSTNNRVGVGITSPQANMHVSDTGDTAIQITKQGSVAARVKTVAGALAIGVDGANGDTERMRITSTGSVGIGTSSPSAIMTVQKNGDVFHAQSAATSAPRIGMFTNSAAGTVGLFASRTDTIGFPALTFSTSDTERMRLDASGRLLVGTTSANGTEILQLAAGGVQWSTGPNTTNGSFDVLNASGTGVYLSSGSTSWAGLSDERFKDIIEPITNASEKVSSLRPIIGKYKTDEAGVRRSFLIAQDVQAVFPEAVDAGDKNKLGLRYGDMVPLLTAALQEALNEIAALKDRVAALETV